MKLSAVKFSFLTVVVLFFAGFAPAQSENLKNFARVDDRLYRGAQPTENGVRELARMGVKTIIDLRGDDEKAEREKVWARKAGVKFVAVGLSNWFKPKTADIERIIRQIDAPENQPVFVHCRRGADRTGTVVAAYRIAHDDWTAKQAIDEAKRFDFGWWQFRMRDFIEDYYRDFLKQKR